MRHLITADARAGFGAAAYGAMVPEERRSSRPQLVEIVRVYMEGISKHDGTIPHFSYRCDRYNAGFKWTNNPDNPESRGGDGKVRSIEEFGGPGGYPPDSGFPDR